MLRVRTFTARRKFVRARYMDAYEREPKKEIFTNVYRSARAKKLERK